MWRRHTSRVADIGLSIDSHSFCAPLSLQGATPPDANFLSLLVIHTASGKPLTRTAHAFSAPEIDLEGKPGCATFQLSCDLVKQLRDPQASCTCVPWHVYLFNLVD